MKSNDFDTLLQNIPNGEINAISMSALAMRMDVTERELRSMILRARKAGCLIAASSSGYFKPKTEFEMLTYYRTRFAAAMSTLASLKETRRHLKDAGFDVLAIENEKKKNKVTGGKA